ncbi:hypothetical protein GFS31_04290 [Leptolyngbya sp. BL0902]|uniref:hypothetical protein n=1 Tax=Leptolyngbya sp. BL0902 TaxID=1115757 RepID=UPI0018E8A12E|nr:hypothetical protein [Leptolyngbya sp. BL0902]QQE63760.1 hypothetical protein GFS31_04290 [Leptolyngbya sp. BL0902]
MKITTLSSLAVATAALALSATAAHAVAGGCAASKAFTGLTTLNAPTEGAPTDGLISTPDAQALAKAIGGFGAAATLIAGGTLLYRRRQDDAGLAAEVLAEGPLPETALDFEVQAESVLVAEEALVDASLLEAALANQETAAQAEDTALSLSR